jgi:hypothetical protein
MLNKLNERGLITLPPKAQETGKNTQVRLFKNPTEGNTIVI